MDPDMRLTVRQFIDPDCDASSREVLTNQEILDTVKITNPNSESNSVDELPYLASYTNNFWGPDCEWHCYQFFRTQKTNDRSQNQQFFRHSEILISSGTIFSETKNCQWHFLKKVKTVLRFFFDIKRNKINHLLSF